MKNISAWAIRHPVPPIVLFAVLFFLGVAAFIRLPINLNPDVAYPLVNVIISQPGAAPSEMETQIAQKIETSISGIGNVRNITTYIIEGQVELLLEFQIGTPIDRAVSDVRDAVAKVRNELPQGIMEPTDLPQNDAKFSLPDRQVPIRASLPESARRNLVTLENLFVPTASGGAVPLKAVAELSFGHGPSAIRRYNQSRRVFIEADLSPGIELGTAIRKIYALPALVHLPQGVQVGQEG